MSRTQANPLTHKTGKGDSFLSEQIYQAENLTHSRRKIPPGILGLHRLLETNSSALYRKVRVYPELTAFLGSVAYTPGERHARLPVFPRERRDRRRTLSHRALSVEPTLTGDNDISVPDRVLEPCGVNYQPAPGSSSPRRKVLTANPSPPAAPLPGNSGSASGNTSRVNPANRPSHSSITGISASRRPLLRRENSTATILAAQRIVNVASRPEPALTKLRHDT